MTPATMTPEEREAEYRAIHGSAPPEADFRRPKSSSDDEPEEPATAIGPVAIELAERLAAHAGRRGFTIGDLEQAERDIDGAVEADLRQRYVDAMLERIPPRFADARMTAAAGADERVMRWCVSFIHGETDRGLLIAGPTGTGKTWHVWAALRWLVEHRWHGTVETWKLVSLLNALRPGGSHDEPFTIVGRLVRADLLVMDDIGAHKPSEWTDERLYEIIDGRYDYRRPIIATTNVKPGEMSTVVGERAASRLIELCDVVAMVGPDRRQADGS